MPLAKPRRRFHITVLDWYGQLTDAVKITVTVVTVIASTAWTIASEIPGPFLAGIVLWIISGLLLLFYVLARILPTWFRLDLKVKFFSMGVLEGESHYEGLGQSHLIYLATFS